MAFWKLGECIAISLALLGPVGPAFSGTSPRGVQFTGFFLDVLFSSFGDVCKATPSRVADGGLVGANLALIFASTGKYCAKSHQTWMAMWV